MRPRPGSNVIRRPSKICSTPMANRVSCLWISATGGRAASPPRNASHSTSIQPNFGCRWASSRISLLVFAGVAPFASCGASVRTTRSASSTRTSSVFFCVVSRRSNMRVVSLLNLTRSGSLGSDRSSIEGEGNQGDTKLLIPQRHHGIDAHRPPRRNITCQQGGESESNRDNRVRCWIARADADEEIADQARESERGCASDNQPYGHDQETLPQDHSENLRPLSAQRHPDSNLVRALACRIGNNSVHPDHCQNQSKEAQSGSDSGAQLKKQKAVQSVKALLHRLNAEKRQIGSKTAYDALRFANHRVGWSNAADFERLHRAQSIILRERQIEEYADGAGQAGKAAVFCDPDHLKERIGGAADPGEMFANGILLRPEAVGKSLIHDGDVRGAADIAIRKRPALKDRNMHRLEESGRNNAVRDQWQSLAGRILVVRNLQVIIVADAAHRSARSERGGLHAGQCVYAPEK